MKILIVAIPRTGSSNLLFSLAEENRLVPLFEPFDKSGRVKYTADMKDVVVKTMIFQHHNIVELAKEFTQIILLSRKDLIKCSESYAYFKKNKVKHFKSYYPYYYEDVSEEEFVSAYREISELNSKLFKLSQDIKVPITYYEDIYDEDSPYRLRKFKKEDLNPYKVI